MNNLLKRAKTLGYVIKNHYQSFGVNINVTKVQIISHLLRYIYLIELLPGTKVKSIFSYAPDVQAALRLHLFCPFKTGTAILIAVSESDVKENSLLDILRSPQFSNSTMQIPLALGYNLIGSPYITDLVKLHHLVISGPSGTGKSVALQCIILSILVKCPVNSVRLILFDIGANSLSIFSTVKQLYHPIVKDVKTGIRVLESLVSELDKRTSIEENVNMPFCVCIIDEFDDTLANIDSKEDTKRFITAINSIIRRGRKAKIILILASHNSRSIDDKINIKGILPRIVFQCFDHYDSSTALGNVGAENLSGDGAMLFKSQDKNNSVLLQGSYVSIAEIEKILSNAPVGYDDIDMLDINESIDMENIPYNDTSEKSRQQLADILFWVLGHTTTSVHQIQKKFKTGNRTREIVNVLNEMQIVSDQFSKQPRKVIPNRIDDLSVESKRLLEHYGYTLEQIRGTFAEKNGGIYNVTETDTD